MCGVRARACSVVYLCCVGLFCCLPSGMDEVGIYRVAGVLRDVTELRQAFDTGTHFPPLLAPSQFPLCTPSVPLCTPSVPFVHTLCSFSEIERGR